MRTTYEQSAHAMQSGVAMKMQYDAGETTAKHLRVGVNAAMVESAALAKLLMDKGVITAVEYAAAMTKAMEEEAVRYEVWLSTRLNRSITLG